MKTLLLFISFFIIAADAATVRLYFTDPLTNDKDTNAFYITPIGTNVLSSGGVVGRGVTTRYVPASNGYRTNTLAVGHYSITNRSLGSGVVIRVPDSSSLYDYTNILISGYNIFVTVTNGDSGTSGALTNNDTRAVTFDTSLTIGAGSAANSIHPSAGLITFSNSILANGSYIKGHSIIGTNFVGNGASLTNLHGSNSITAGTIDTNRMDATAYAAFVGGGDVTQSGLAAGSYAVAGNGLGLTNLSATNGLITAHGITIRAEYVNDGQFIGPNTYAGHPLNYIAPGNPGCFIAGGITNTGSGGAYTNTILDRISTIAGGVGNWIGENSEGSFIGSGEQNKIMDDCTHGVIGGGEINTIEGIAEWGVVAGGHHNAISLGAGRAVVIGGDSNTNGGSWSILGGGYYNYISGLNSVLMGGETNRAIGNYSFVSGGFLNNQQGHASSIIGSRITNSLNGAQVIGYHTNTLTVQSNGTVSTTGVFTGNGSALTNLLTSYAVSAGGTVATMTDTAALLNFGTTDPSVTIANAGVYILMAGAACEYTGWTPDINASTLTIKLRRTSGSPDDIVGGAASIDLDTVMVAYTGPVGIISTPMLIYTSAGSETIQLWGGIGVAGAGGSITARSAWITAVKIR
jgi:hypothetical protein